MALGNLFKLNKLTISAFTDQDRASPAGELEVQYNPETLSMRHETVFQGQQGPGTSSGQAKFSYSRSRDLSVSLVFDGTNVGLFGIERLGRAIPSVGDRIKEFLDVCYRMDGELHEPKHLRLRWGDAGVLGPDFDCRLRSVDIRYTAFNRDGSPLHAELEASFVENLSPSRRAAQERKASPDLTHRRVVVAGDTLPRLCREIYGAPEHYLRVAEVNGLDDVRALEPGQELYFPPFARRGAG